MTASVRPAVVFAEPIVSLEAEWHHDPLTVVHSLVMDRSHSFIASGFVVSGWARDDDFDYATWTPREAPCP